MVEWRIDSSSYDMIGRLSPVQIATSAQSGSILSMSINAHLLHRTECVST